MKQNNVGTTGGLIAQVVSDVLAGCPKAIVWGLNADHARRLLFEVYRGLQQAAEPYSVWMRRDDVIDYCGSEVHAVSEYTSWVQEKLRGASVYVDHAVMEAWDVPSMYVVLTGVLSLPWLQKQQSS